MLRPGPLAKPQPPLPPLLFPPLPSLARRIWEQRDGTSWIQYTSKAPASRADVTTLQGTLDQRLLHRQARESGICPVREELYRQTLGEFRASCPSRASACEGEDCPARRATLCEGFVAACERERRA